MHLSRVLALLLVTTFALPALAEDWPMWGGSVDRNMVAQGKNLPSDFGTGEWVGDTDEIDVSNAKNVKWIAKLGSQAYGNLTVSNSKIFIGTNNDSPRDPKYKGDRSNLYCLDEATGKLLWQLTVPKLGSGKVNDWEYLGICSSPSVDGDRVYVLTNRCDVVCLDVNGLADGNQGVTDEAEYIAGPKGEAQELSSTDADIIWRYDMREELGVFPHNITSSSPLIVNDMVYIVTSNGVDWSHIEIPNPNAPALIALDKKTGELKGEEMSGISTRILHSNWSSPTYGEIDGKGMIIFGAGDGWCYAFDPKPVVDEDGFGELKELWRFDGNPPEYRVKNGAPVRYTRKDGLSEYIATPVFVDGKVYAAIGQDPEHGTGMGYMSCIDASKRGDITKTGKVWGTDVVMRSISTAAVKEGLVYIGDYTGDLHCLDAKTGKQIWKHETGGHIWSSPLIVDGKVYLGNEYGDLHVFKHGREKKLLNTVEMVAPVHATPIVANNVLYIQLMTHLYAIEADK